MEGDKTIKNNVGRADFQKNAIASWERQWRSKFPILTEQQIECGSIPFHSHGNVIRIARVLGTGADFYDTFIGARL